MQQEIIKVVNSLQVTKRERAELTPYVNGEVHSLTVALQSPKIAHCTDQEIKNALKYPMLLVGLKTSTISAMGEEEKLVLVNYLRRYFGVHTCEELKLAFEKAIAGELNLPAKEVKAYENFSCIYVGTIMRAYREWAKVEYREGGVQFAGRKELPAPVQTPKEQYAFWKEEIMGGVNVSYIPSSLFDAVREVDNIEPTEAGTQVALKKAKDYLIVSLQKGNVDKESERKLVRLSGNILDWQQIPDIQKLAKAFWCQRYILHKYLK